MNILVLPDMQVKEGVPLQHLDWIGEYIVDKQPDVIVNIGDWADMPSLSSYDVGKKSFEGRRYHKDITASKEAMEKLLAPLKAYNKQKKKNKEKQYHPRMVLTLGNHENRINRAVENDPKLDGMLDVKDLEYEEFGWEVLPFLEVVSIGGVCFSHYFTTGVMGRPVTTPNALLTKKHRSCVMGHVQSDGVASQYTADGKRITGIFVGCGYLHDEEYLGAQGNRHARSIWMLYDVNDGEFEHIQVSLRYLDKKYGEGNYFD
jgi:hypothetical protein